MSNQNFKTMFKAIVGKNTQERTYQERHRRAVETLNKKSNPDKKWIVAVVAMVLWFIVRGILN